jgi:hypothetical protein
MFKIFYLIVHLLNFTGNALMVGVGFLTEFRFAKFSRNGSETSFVISRKKEHFREISCFAKMSF